MRWHSLRHVGEVHRPSKPVHVRYMLVEDLLRPCRQRFCLISVGIHVTIIRATHDDATSGAKTQPRARCKSAVANQTVFLDRYLLDLLVIKHTSGGGVNRYCDNKSSALIGAPCCLASKNSFRCAFGLLQAAFSFLQLQLADS